MASLLRCNLVVIGPSRHFAAAQQTVAFGCIATVGEQPTPRNVRVKFVELGIRLATIECRRVKLPATTWSSLKAAADCYGMTVARLARLLIEIIVRDALFDAVIDDVPRARRRTKFRHGSGVTLHQPRV